MRKAKGNRTTSADVASIALSVPAPPTVGTPTTQSSAILTFDIYAKTVNAAAVTIDTGYSPPVGHGAKLDGGWSAEDVANSAIRGGNFNAVLRNLAGGLGVAGQLFGGALGDAALNTAVPGFSIVAGTLHVIFAPPAGYVGTVQWRMELTATEN
jgi:hypothetical protein